MIKIMFVCLGNICRSPLAHAVMEKKISETHLKQQVSVDSSGTGSWHIGDHSDPRMIKEAAKHQVPMTHLAKQFQPKDESNFNYIFGMDQSNLENIRLIIQKPLSEKFRLFRCFEGSSLEVPDPYFGGEQGFSLVYEIVNRNCDLILDYLKSYHPQLRS